MKQIVSEQDALYNSAMWNFHRVAYDHVLLDANKMNNYLKISYIIAGMYDVTVLFDALKLMLL